MAINVATKYEKQLATAMTLGSVIAGRYNTDYTWDGVKSIVVLTPVTQPLVDYTRSGTNRYGTPQELQDTKQELPITKDKSFAVTVDKGNNSEQQHAKEKGRVLRAQIGEQVVPFWDKHALKTWAEYGAANGKKLVVATPDKDNVIDMFINARKELVDNNFPIDVNTCTAYVTSSVYALLLKNPLFMNVDTLAKEMLTKGTVGQCQNFLVKEVPESYLPAGTHALFTHKKAVISASKINECKTHDDPPGISGTLFEGRTLGDAFGLDVFKKGIVVVQKV